MTAFVNKVWVLKILSFASFLEYLVEDGKARMIVLLI